MAADYESKPVDAQALAAAFGGPATEGDELAESVVDDDGRTRTDRPSSISTAAASDVMAALKEALDDARISWDASSLHAAVAALLSSQFVLFAGPSGTGKSTLARALMDFFVPPDAQGVIEARRQMLGPEDLVGFRSPISDQFVRGFAHSALAALHDAGSEDLAASAVLVEEVNLSSVEGYLSAFMHALSGPSVSHVPWQLYDPADDPVPGVLAELSIGPWPRLLGTINVDATALAPSPKVAARASVVLLLPSAHADTRTAITSLRSQRTRVRFSETGASLLGDPALAVADGAGVDLNRLVDAVNQTVASVAAVAAPSNRQIVQMALYCAWFVLLADGGAGPDRVSSVGPSGEATPSDLYKLGAENALLYFLLPSLRADEFSEALGVLNGLSSLFVPPSAEREVLGGLLGSRVERLAASDDGSAGRYLDYWDRLS